MYAADARHRNKSLEDKLQSIYELRGGPAIDLTIRKPYTDLLAALGNPHQHLPPVIHVAGTNGKGSVIAMMRAVLEQAGYNVHTYTSPHLIRFNERIVLAGKEIEDAHLETLLDEVLTNNKQAGLTFFEITTAMAFTAFSRTPADICLLETGLGGRLDCTNVIENPAAVVITRIGLDHMEFLGDTPEKIAAEKAGIMKKGTPCILAPQQNEIIDSVFELKAKALGCRLIKAEAKAIPATNMTGPHQTDNTAAALSAIYNLENFSISQSHIDTGLQSVCWRARLQKIDWQGMAPGYQLWIDGGHNESAGQALAKQLQLWAEQDRKPLHLIIGMIKTKDVLSFVRPLLPYTRKITCVAIPDEPAALSPAELKEILQPHTNIEIGLCGNHKDIRSIASGNEKQGERILIAGSLYLAGACLELFEQR